jgi:sugar phosphate isomerase/epimerase
MSFSTPELTLAEMLEVARRYGYDGIEPRLDAKHAHGIERQTTPAQRAAIRQQVAASGISLACLATSLTYADPQQRDETLRQTHECIDLAGDLGVPVIRVFGGMIPQGVSREQAIDLVVTSLRSAAQHAAERKVIIAMETHDDWCDPAHVATVMERVAHPAIAVNWDIMHPVRMGKATIDQSFNALRRWIRHLHLHDGTGKDVTLAPIGTGDYDHRRTLELLKTIRYDGYLSGEWIGWEPYATHLPRELVTLKGYEQNLGHGKN